MRTMKNRNIKNIRGWDVSAEIAEKCFTDEQKQILEYTQGQIKITIEDQINKIYGCRIATWDKETTIKYASIIVEEYSYLLEEIKTWKELARQAKNPDNYAEVTLTNDLGNTTSGSNIKTESSTRSSGIFNSWSDSESSGIDRVLRAHPSELIKLTDINDRKELSLLELQRTRISFELGDSSDKEKLFKTELTINPTEQKSNKEESLPYHYSDLSKNTSLGRAEAQNYTDNRDRSNTNTDSMNNVCLARDTKTNKRIKADDYYNAMKREIPRLRARFWNKFLPLFNDLDICTYR